MRNRGRLRAYHRNIERQMVRDALEHTPAQPGRRPPGREYTAHDLATGLARERQLIEEAERVARAAGSSGQ